MRIDPFEKIRELLALNAPVPDLKRQDLERQKLAIEIHKLQLEADEQGRMMADSQEARRVREIQRQTILFNDEIYGSSVANCLHRLDSLVAIDPAARITIVFNSPGGGVIDGLHLYDHILMLRSRGTPIDTTIMGYGASMAGILVQAGEVRRIGPYAYLMAHELANISWGKLSSLKDQVALAEQMYERLLNILAGRAKLTKDEIRTKADRRDWWMTATEALEAGFVDEILPTTSVTLPTTAVTI